VYIVAIIMMINSLLDRELGLDSVLQFCLLLYQYINQFLSNSDLEKKFNYLIYNKSWWKESEWK